MGNGRVDLVGAGPGDPGLITLRGREALERADVVVHDALAAAALLDLARPGAERIDVGKRAGRHSCAQDDIVALLIEHARAGRRVVRLKGGDPMVFGRGAEEAEALRAAGVPFAIVPGVTAALAAAACAERPLTHRDHASTVTFVTGHSDPAGPRTRVDWPRLAALPGTLVVYMGLKHLPEICRTLVRHGRDPGTPAVLVSDASLPGQRTIAATLADLPDRVSEADPRAPGLLMIGEAPGAGPERSWLEGRPLHGQRVLVTRPEADAAGSAESLETLGAEVLLAPLVRIDPLEDPGPLDAVLRRLREFDWLAFTSRNGVRHLLERLSPAGLDLRALGGLKLACVGPGTAEELARHHLRADLVPVEHNAEALAEALATEAAGGRILIARADRGRTVLADRLAGVARVESVVVYHHRDADRLPAGAEAALASDRLHWITLTSPAAVERLDALLPAESRPRVGRSIRLATISPLTSAAAADRGWEVAAEARKATWPALVERLVETVEAEPQANSR
jgi:uroporphyrinogen III methyltransferase/synthase